MELGRHVPSLVLIPAPSAALIMEESPEASPLAGSRASVEVFTEEAVSTGAAVSTAVEALTVAEVTGNSVLFVENNLRNGEPNDAHGESDNRDIFRTEAQLDGCASRSCIPGGGRLSMESRAEIGTKNLFVTATSE